MFHLYTAMFGVLDGLTQRNLHLTMMLLVVFLLKPSKLKYIGPVYDLVLMIATLAVGAYMHVASADMAYRAGTVYMIDNVCCMVLIVLILVGVKRVMGWAMPIISFILLLYVFLGQYLPQPFGHAPYTMRKITSLLYMGTEGIWSSPLAASSTFIRCSSVWMPA